MASPSTEAGGGAVRGPNPYLSGNYAPVTAELTVDAPLPVVVGAVPPALDGMLLRNGPNPARVSDPSSYHWFSGDGMIHAIGLAGGRAVSYKNRWVRTARLAAELGTAPPPGPKEPLRGPANTHVIAHAGMILALVESGLPHRLTRDLETVCLEDFDAMLASPMTAHPHLDPETGGLAFFGYDLFGPPFLRYHEMDASGMLVHSTPVELPRPVMMHDAGVTATSMAFLDLPVVFDLDLARAGVSLPFRWQPEAGARVGVLERGAPGSQVRWSTLDPCFAFHVMNAFDDGPAVVLDVCRYEQTFDLPPGQLLGSTLPTLERWRVDPASGRVTSTQLDDRTIEFPRIDDHLAGRPYRYGYCVELSRSGGTEGPVGLVRYDLVRDEALHFDPGPDRQPGEPVFVRAPDGHSDDEGWVLSVVYDAQRDASDLVILDATRFEGPPEAVIELPGRVPFGFHGSWVPAASLP